MHVLALQNLKEKKAKEKILFSAHDCILRTLLSLWYVLQKEDVTVIVMVVMGGLHSWHWTSCQRIILVMSVELCVGVSISYLQNLLGWMVDFLFFFFLFF